MKNSKEKTSKQLFTTSILLLLVAIVSVSAVTVAWFTISDNTRVNMLSMDVTTGKALRMDLNAHATFDEYLQTLPFEDIADRILRDRGFDMRSTPLQPVTTSNGRTFTFQNGSLASPDNGTYLEFTLHFMATDDMLLHLTSDNAKNEENGTLIWSDDNPNLAKAMRISFEADGKVFTYNPNKAINKQDSICFLKAETDKPVIVRIWMEGTDPYCNNDMKGLEYSIRMRFEGTGLNNEPLS